MAKNETAFWQELKAELDAQKLFYTRIESSTANGIPDLYLTYDGCAIWCELKAIAHNPGTTLLRLPRYTRLQKEFLHRHWRAGGTSCLLVRYPRGVLCLMNEHAFTADAVSGQECLRRSLLSNDLSMFPAILTNGQKRPAREAGQLLLRTVS